MSKLYIIRDGVITLSGGQPASNLIHYDAFGKRYVERFDDVNLVARLFEKEDKTAKPVEGPGFNFIALPGYHGPIGLIKNIKNIIKVVGSTLDKDCFYILRVPSTMPSIYAAILYVKKIPFAVEVVGDPEDSYSTEALNSKFLSLIFKTLFVSALKFQCRHAVACAYVTSSALQKKYPPRSKDREFSFTSIDLSDETFVDEPKHFVGPECVLVITGNMQKMLKGHDVLLQSVSQLKKAGRRIRLLVIGFGENQPFFEKMAQDLGIKEDVRFFGKVAAGKAIRDILDTADLFVLPSRQEGLPRALLEAMARGLPAIATDVGGTAELIDQEALIPPNDVDALTRKIEYFIDNEHVMKRHADFNLKKSKGYHIKEVRKARIAFYEKIINSR